MPLLTGAVHGVGEARKEAALLLPVSTVLTLSVLPPPARAPCVGQARSQRRLLSTKSEAVPAEGVVHLTLHRPEAQKGNGSHKKAPAVGKSIWLALAEQLTSSSCAIVPKIWK